MEKFDDQYFLLQNMFEDTYYPQFLVEKIKWQFIHLIEFRQPQAGTATADLSSDVISARLETVGLIFTPGTHGFVFFSQLSAWLSVSHGATPRNILYRYV